MKNFIASLLLFSSASAFAADKVGTITSLEVTFQKLGDTDTAVAIKGTVVGYACQEAFTKPVLELATQDVDMFAYKVSFAPRGLGISHFVCLDLSTIERPFKASLVLDTDYELYNSFIEGVEDPEIDTAASLDYMKEQAVCSFPTLPAFAGGLFGPGPVVPESCVYKWTK
ncbi:MAG: hypothetical protein EOP04_20965 [Proteobacteria bacterium]|nr:MAG: hypothetical protein EOP04_20965 [Pseudomonadota bacterium]